MDTIMDEAKDVLDEAGDVVKEVGEAIKEGGDESGAGGGAGGHSGGGASSGGQTVSRPPKPTGFINTGQSTPLASETVGPNGGTVTVQNPGDPLDGLEIQVPPGSYPDSRQFDVSSAPVEDYDFGEYFTPATSLISIENGGDYSDEFMTVTIPVEVPPDHFAMAFYYDETSGTLEGMPFSAVDEQSITIVTRHFCDIIVSIVRNTALQDLIDGDIDSHFRPGIDDWQFVNNGSYVAANGHCAGQCLTALWYYCEQPDGQDLALNGRYDNNGNHPATPDLWADDSHGYRLASTVQKDLGAVWLKFENQFFRGLAGVDDEANFQAFAYAIELTGEPQVIYVWSSANGGGHAMVVYRVLDNKLYISDPNYPGNVERRIVFTNGQMEPYESGANAAEIAAGNSTTYDDIGYVAKSASVGWNVIAARWNEFKAGTIGNDVFPACQVVAVDSEGKETPLLDGYESKDKKIAFVTTCGNTPIGQRVYRDGARLAQDDKGDYELKKGNNLIGVEIWGDVNNNPQSRNYRYIDFEYFNIQYGEEETECSGWVLDSVDVIHDYGGENTEYEQYIQPLQHSNGSFSYTVRWPVRDLSPGQPGGEVYATYSQSGSWTPPPDCLAPDEPITVSLQMSSSVDAPSAAEAPAFDDIHGILLCELVASGYQGRIDQHVDRDTPSLEDSTIAELTALHEGTDSYNAVSVEVKFLAFASVTYRYNYVWQG